MTDEEILAEASQLRADFDALAERFTAFAVQLPGVPTPSHSALAKLEVQLLQTMTAFTRNVMRGTPAPPHPMVIASALSALPLLPIVRTGVRQLEAELKKLAGG